MEKKRNEFIAQGSILAVASILVRVIGIVYRIPVTNIIGDKGNGYYSLAYSVYTILLLLSSYSLPLAVSKMVSARVERGQWVNVKRVLQCAILFGLCVGTLFAVLVLLGAKLFTSVFFHTEMAAIALRFMSPTILIMAMLGVFRGFFQGLQNTIPTAISQIFEQIVNAIVAVLCAYFLFHYGASLDAAYGTEELAFAWGAAGNAIGTGAGALVALLFCFVLYLAYRGRLEAHVRADKTQSRQGYPELFRTLMYIALPVIFSTALYNLVDLIDASLFSWVMSARDLLEVKDEIWGAYNGKAILLVHVPVSIASAMAVSLVPTLTAAYSTGKKKLAKAKVGATMRFIATLAFPSAVGLMILAYPIIKTLFSSDTSDAWIYLTVASLAVIAFSFSTISNSILQGVDRMDLPVRHSLVAMAVHIVVLLLLSWGCGLGIYGVIVSYVVYGLVIAVLNFRSIGKILQYRLDVVTVFVKPILASAVMGLACFVVYRLLGLFAGMAIPMVVSVVVAVLVYFVVAVKIGLLTESAMRDFPKGSALVKLAKRMKLL